MPKAEQDTEITLGTGRMLVLFFALVAICGVFFAIGFSLGRKAAMPSPVTVAGGQTQSPAVVVRPGAGKNNQPAPNSQDLGFYKAVEQKTPDGQLTPADNGSPVTPPAAETKPSSNDANSTPPANAYYVQVAAVTRQEDADALVEALKKKQYPAFVSNNAASGDKFFHVQVGPFAEVKDAEATRGKLVGDGYNPIVKK